MKITSLIYWFNFGLFFNLISCQVTQAQIVPDRSLPNNSVVTKDGRIIQIEGGTKKGDNLFHSFEEFSVPVDNTASFNNAVEVQNIFSRVTGNSISEIEGILETQGTANLFLINPNGIIFGENSALNVGGSFLATTAESVRFADETQFKTTDSQTTPLLTVTAPIGLDLGTNPGQIINRSITPDISGEFDVGLQVQPGNTISLLGGEVTLDGGVLTADEGRIELGSVGKNNLVTLIPDRKGWQLTYNAVSNFQDINLFQESIISSVSDAGGDIQIHGKNINVIEDSWIASIASVSEAGNVVIKGAKSITLEGNNSEILNEVEETATGQQARLYIETEKLSILGGKISAATFGKGNGSRLNVNAKELIIKDGGQISTSTFGEGNAGNLKIITSDSILLEGRDSKTNFPSGIFAQVEPEGEGNGGSLSIETSKLTVLNGAQISTAARNDGRGGNININVSDSILLSGTSSFGDVENSPSAIFPSAQPEATNNSGNIQLQTRQLIVEKGAFLSANNRGTGQGGSVDIDVNSLIVRDGGQIGAGSLVDNDAVDNIRGSGGTISINATESVEVIGKETIRNQIVKSSIFTRSEGTGDSGNLTIMTPQLNIAKGGNVNVSAIGTGEAGSLTIEAQNLNFNRGNLTAETRRGNQGNITLNNADTLLLRNDSQITTNASEQATGGDITIASDTIALLDGSDLTANADVGRGGSILITTQGLFQEPNSTISAESRLNIDGTININSPDVDPTSEIVQLSDAPIDAEAILAQNLCKLENEKIAKGSSFIITGRGGLTPTSEESLGNVDNVVGWANRADIEIGQSEIVGVRQRKKSNSLGINQPIIKQSQGWVTTSDGDVWLVANSPKTIPQNATVEHPDCQTH